MTGDAWDAPLSAVRNHVEDLGAWLAVWSRREEGKPDAHARRCASDAVDAIDGALAGLHRIRASLIGDLRQADATAAARVDAMLARRREIGPQRETQFPELPADAGDSEREPVAELARNLANPEREPGEPPVTDRLALARRALDGCRQQPAQDRTAHLDRYAEWLAGVVAAGEAPGTPLRRPEPEEPHMGPPGYLAGVRVRRTAGKAGGTP